MMAPFARCLVAALGFGSVVCVNRDARQLASELRSFGLVASDSTEPGIDFDFLVLDDVAREFSENHLLLSKVKKAVVLVIPSEAEHTTYLKKFYEIGFRLHPRGSVFDLLALRSGFQFCIVERGSVGAGEELLAQLPMAASLWAEIAELASAGGSVLALGSNAVFAARVIAANSLKTQPTFAREEGPFSLVVSATSRDLTEINLNECVALLHPGGRLVIAIFSEGREEIEDRNWLKPMLPSTLLPEALYVMNEAPKAIREVVWMRYDLREQQYWTNGWQAIVLVRTPTDSDIQFPKSEFPGFSFHDFASQYDNPWLVRAMVSVETRLMSPRLLEVLADEIIASRIGNVDKAAAYCVKAYLLMGQDQDWKVVQSFIEDFTPLSSIGTQTTAVEVRWAISLLFVKGLLEQKYGHRDEARLSFEHCAEGPFMRFGPMLATKTIAACRQVALMCISEGDLDGARRWFGLGIKDSIAATKNEYFDASAPYPLYFLAEISQVLALGAQCNGALLALKEKEISPLLWDAMRCDIISQIEDERFVSQELRRQLFRLL